MAALPFDDASYFHMQPQRAFLLNATLPDASLVNVATQIEAALPPGVPWYTLEIGAQSFDYDVALGEVLVEGDTTLVVVPAGQMKSFARIQVGQPVRLAVAAGPETIALQVFHPAVPGF